MFTLKRKITSKQNNFVPQEIRKTVKNEAQT